jgi:hypothetical protein
MNAHHCTGGQVMHYPNVWIVQEKGLLHYPVCFSAAST